MSIDRCAGARGALAAAAFVAMVSSSTAGHAASLQDEVFGLLETHPQIQAAEQNLEATRQGIRQERSAHMPQANVSAGAGVEYTDSPATRAAGFDNKELFATNATLELRQNLFNGFGSVAGVRSAKALTEAADYTLTAVTQNVLLEASTAYLNVLRTSELYRLNQGNEFSIQEQLELEDERVQRGSGIAVDVLEAKSRLQIAKEQSVTFQGALKDAIANYLQVFGHAPNVSEMMAVTPMRSFLPESKEAAIELIRNASPVLQIAQAQIDSASHERLRAKSTYWPTVDVVGLANVENNLAGIEDVRRDLSIKLELTWAIFDGFLTPATSAAAGARYQEAIENGRNVSNRTIELMEISWHEMEVADERAELLRNAMNIAAEVFRSRVELREAGKETAINVLDSQSALYTACINFVNAFFDSEVAAFRVLNTVGQLDREAVANVQPVERSTVVEQCGFTEGERGYRLNGG